MSDQPAATVAEINTLHAKAEAGRPCLVKLGELLHQAKDDAGHGNWLAWLKANCPKITTQRASEYIRVFKKSKLPTSGNLKDEEPCKPETATKSSLEKLRDHLNKAAALVIKVSGDSAFQEELTEAIQDVLDLLSRGDGQPPPVKPVKRGRPPKSAAPPPALADAMH